MNRLKFVLVWALCFLAINNVACQNSREILSNIEMNRNVGIYLEKFWQMDGMKKIIL